MGCTSSVPSHKNGDSNLRTMQMFTEQLDQLDKDGPMDIRALVMLIWESRDKPDFQELIVKFMQLRSNDKHVFTGIEFYMPQLAHMLVHLEVDWPVTALEQFTLLVTQQSLHLALRLCWILVGLMEDYQAEDANGVRNPSANTKLYNRCAMLLTKLETSVVFGSPTCTKFEELYHNGTITREELLEAERADRIYQAYRIADEIPEDKGYLHDGFLEYKRPITRGVFHQDGWIKRRFVIGHRVLYCLRVNDNVVKRSIPLHNCKVVVPDQNPFKDKKYYFELHEVHAKHESEENRKFLLSAFSREEMDEWIAALNKAIHSPPPGLEPAGPALQGDGAANIDIKALTPAQLARYGFYRSERDFVTLLTDICEELRFVSNEGKQRTTILRQKLTELNVPGCVYIPLCHSTDPWERIVTTVPDSCFAFSTKERCPCLMTFEVTSDDPEKPQDTATYLYQALGFDDEAEFEELNNNGNGKASNHDAIGDDKDDDNNKIEQERARSRENFVRSARDSITKLDLSSLRSEYESDQRTAAQDAASQKLDGASRRRASTIGAQISHTLWEDEQDNKNETKTKNDAGTDFHERKRLKIQVLKLEAIRLLTKQDPPENKIEEQKDMDSNTGQQQNEGEYLFALGKYSNTPSNDDPSENKDDKEDEEKKVEEDNKERARAESERIVQYGKLIAKSNDDLRQEVFIMQLIQFLRDIWIDKGLNLKLHPYHILSTAQTCGLIEVLQNCNSFHGIKEDNNDARIGDYFKQKFTEPEKLAWIRKNFVESMAGYSLVTYILGIKDRHNGNIMLNYDTGEVTHIDFGFVLGMAPGKDKIKNTDFSLERAAFKLTPELVDAMGGKKSENWAYFNQLLVDGLREARAHVDTLITLVEIMGYKSKLPCFNQPGGGVARVVRELKARLMLGMSDAQMEKKMRKLASHASTSKLTMMYERFQRRSNGLRPCLY